MIDKIAGHDVLPFVYKRVKSTRKFVDVTFYIALYEDFPYIHCLDTVAHKKW
jgi:hypothetical protein